METPPKILKIMKNLGLWTSLGKNHKKRSQKFQENLAYNFTKYILDIPLKVGCKLALSQRAVVVVEKTTGRTAHPPS